MALGDVIARLAVSLSLETAAFEKGNTLAQKQLAQTQRKFEKLGQSMSSLGTKMSVAITAPLTAFGVSAFNAASDAAELQSAFNVTFGEMSDTMNKWAEDTGNAMGRSTQEMQKAANTFGIFFNTAVDRQKAAEMSQTFAELAQDLGSFFNVDTETAIQKLRSGLSGESEPLRDFGVFLTEANVKAKALELGLTGVGNELTEQEKILARYQLIMEATTSAQGDVARTSDQTANQMRKARAAFEELQVTVGTKLLPVITPLIEKLGAAFEWFSQLPEPVQNTALVVGALSAALGPVLIVVGNLLPLLVKLPAVLALVGKALLFIAANPAILALAGVVAGIYLAWRNWDKIAPILERLWSAAKEYIGGALTRVLQAILNPIAAVKRAFFDLYNAVVGNSYIPDMVDGIAAQMQRLDAVMVQPVTKATTKAQEAFRDMAMETQMLLDRLFPEVRKLLDYRADLGRIEGSGLSAEQQREARRRLGIEFGGGGGLGEPDFSGVEPLTGGLKNVEDAIERLTEKAKVGTVRIAKSFKDMADETLQSLSRLTSSIQSGGFLGILEAVIGFGLQLGSVGAFGKTIATRLNNTRGFATGTASAPRGLAWVGERGPELVNFRGGERVYNNRDSRAMMGGQLEIRPSPLFEVYLDGKLIQAAPAIADAGAKGGVARMNQLGARRLA